MTKFTEHLRRRILAFPAKLTATLITLCCLSLTLYALFTTLNIVYVSDSEGNNKLLVTRTSNPEELMTLSGIVAQEADNVYYTAYNGNTASLSIQRAQEITIQADGAIYVAKLVSGDVRQALEVCGLALGEHDYTEPSLHTEINPDTPVVVHRVEYQDTVTNEAIPFETEYVYTSLYYRNKKRTTVMQQGYEGNNEITHRERIVDGELESSQIVSIVETLAPQNTVIKAYQAGAPVSSRTGPQIVDGVPVQYSAVYSGRATGYYSRRGRGASGLGLGYGTVAVNPNLIPYGTKVYITSADGKFVYGYAIATDTGTALMNGTCLVDLYYETYAESLMNGVQQVKMYVVG